jgi:hypothetical protein
MSLFEKSSNADLETSQSGKTPRLRTPDAPVEQQARNSSRSHSVPPHRRTAGHGRGIRRLVPLVPTALMVCSTVLIGSASASPAAGARGSSEHTAGRPQVDRTLARLVLSPAQASIRAGGSLAYSAMGHDAAGHDLGHVTARTSFSIRPDGSCAGASCTATKPGRHTVTGTVHQGHRAISATAALQVEPSRPPGRAHTPPGAVLKPPDRAHAPPDRVLTRSGCAHAPPGGAPTVARPAGAQPGSGVHSLRRKCDLHCYGL